MKKTQDLPFYKGCTNGGYYNSTSAMYTTSPTWLTWNTAEQWGIGVNGINAYRPPPAWAGNQVFESSTRHRPLFNDCSNFKATGKYVPFLIVNEKYNRSNYIYIMRCWIFPIPVGSNPSPAITPMHWSLCDGAQRRAWWSMQPRFEGEVEALNFLFELKDFKDLAKHAMRFNYRNIAGELGKLKSWTGRQLRTIKSEGSVLKKIFKAFSDGTMTVAQAHLIKNFAIDPTISDCMAIHAQAGKLVDEVQQSFFERGLTAQRSHYSEKISETDNTTPGASNYYWVSSGNYSSLTFNATIEYTYDYKMRARVDALKRYYGLNVNAEVIWNMLPFSFVCDYFLKVANALRNMRTDPNVAMRTLQYAESLLQRSSSGYHYNGDSRVRDFFAPDIMDAYGQNNLLSGYESTHFLRRVTHPNKGVALPRVSMPSKRQRQNLIALARVLW